MAQTMHMTAFEDAAVRLRQDIRDHKGSYQLQGVLFLAAGIVAAVLPGMTALSMELLLGVVLLFSGLSQLVFSWHARSHLWATFSALLSMGVGFFLLAKPFAGLFALVAIIAFFLTIKGIFELLLAFEFRPVSNWNWMLVSGVISLILAGLLWAGFPWLGIVYLGWIVAANLVLYGISLLMIASAAGE